MMPFPEEGFGPHVYPATESLRDKDSQEGRTAAIVGGVLPIGDVRNCIFYGIEYKTGTPYVQFGPAEGLAVCPIDKIHRLAHRHVDPDLMMWQYEARDIMSHLWKRFLGWLRSFRRE